MAKPDFARGDPILRNLLIIVYQGLLPKYRIEKFSHSISLEIFASETTIRMSKLLDVEDFNFQY